MSDTVSLVDEVWKPINGYEGIYCISSLARVKSLHSHNLGRILKPAIWRKYPIIFLSKNGRQSTRDIHVLLARAHIPNPFNLPVVNHKNGNKQDLRLVNLEWTTYKKNTAHAFETGLMSHKGIKNAHSKLAEDEVLEIFNSKLNRKELSEIYNIALNSIAQIKTGARWSHLTGKSFLKKRKDG